MSYQLDVHQKLRNVLDTFLLCNVDNSKLEILLKHLSKNENVQLLTAPLVLDWIDESLSILVEDYSRIYHKVISFIFKLCGLVANRSCPITALYDEKMLQKITSIAEANIQKFTSATIVGHVRLTASQTKSHPGLQWIRASKSWRYLIKYYRQNHTVYIAREASNVLFDILSGFAEISQNKEFCFEILSEILEPVNRNNYINTSTIIEVDEETNYKCFLSSLDLISTMLKKAIRTNGINLISYLCEIYYKIDTNVSKLVEETQAKLLLEKLLELQTSCNFAILLHEKWKNNGTVPLHFTQFRLFFFKIMNICMDRKECVLFSKQVQLNLYLWKTSSTEMFLENERIEFQCQLILYHVLPIFYFCKNLNGNEKTVEQYILKLFGVSSESVAVIVYTFRDILLDCPDLAAHLAHKSIHGILSLIHILNDQTSVICKTLVYALGEIGIYVTHEKNIHCDLIRNISQILHAIFVGLYAIFQGDPITWAEYIEPKNLIDIALIILRNENLPPLIKVQTVKLTQISMKHFLAAEQLPKSELDSINLIITQNINNAEWEVCDSVLELVTSIVSVSRLKFLQLQHMVVQNDICSLVYCVVKSENEHYIRASGLKCLTEMVSVDLLWEKCIARLNINEYVMLLICDESEAIVRKEATILLTKMKEYRRINTKSLMCVYCILSHGAVNDLYWEVQIAALNFWENEIDLRLANYGLMDGKINSIMFSKEVKNIDGVRGPDVVLRIKEVLSELSQIGCLNVVLKCLDENCDLEPVKVAVRMVQKILKPIKQYEFESFLDDADYVIPKKENKTFEIFKEENKHLESDSKICETLKTDIDGNVATNDMQVPSNSYEQQRVNFDCAVKKAKIIVIEPKEFLDRLRNIDFDSFVENRKNFSYCSENITSVLDDILHPGELMQTCLMECY